MSSIEQNIQAIRECVQELRGNVTDNMHLDLILAHLGDVDADAEALQAQNARLAAYASDLERGGVSLGHIKRARVKHLHDGDMEGLA